MEDWEDWIERETSIRVQAGRATFDCDASEALRAALALRGPLAARPDGYTTARGRDGSRWCVALPPLLRAAPGGDAAPNPDGLHLVLLLQAGAAALGLFEEGRLFAHKNFKRYVVRGQGRAQPTHLRTRGKSRYGARLRLQNARKLFVEVNERLVAWRDELGDPERLFFSCPQRAWADLFATRPPPPYPRERFERVALDLHVPSLRELERVHRHLRMGRLWREPPPDTGAAGAR